ncbi:Aste57867_24279 [Aphanomyces stellatus]|uniref:Aste57867_24279 protein n=1 Tax=Aphanomyces stellatus TaxID=120398 RepID=A0A485LPY1_9STRA|nr:hypothetical protein As57867_024204 [Aphanomyces stellatus]VFU00919.1 Aste57867_24279 [Aphanomyces stellatus]
MSLKGRQNNDILSVEQIINQDDWVPNSERQRCHVCTRNFTHLRRKHHCRMCGEVVCGNCTLKKLAQIPQRTSLQEVRVCMSCVLNHANKQANPMAAQQQQQAAVQARGRGSIQSTRTDRTDTDSRAGEVRYSNRESNMDRLDSPPENSAGERTQFSRDDESSDIDYPLDFSWGYAWPKPPVLPDEVERLAALRSFDILDTPTEDVFDIICDLASNALKCPIAVVSLIDEDRQWFKASIGLAQTEIPRNVSFCAHTIRTKEPMVVLDTLLDKRFMKNPLVTGAATIRFYAGSPIVAPSGHVIGTVFVFDNQPRQSCDLATLEKLSNVAMKNLEDRKNGGAPLPPLRAPSAPAAAQPPQPPQMSMVPSNAVSPDNLNTQDLVVQGAGPGDGQVVGGPKMETMLMDLLCRTTETQQQLAAQQGVMFQQLGQHTQKIDELADAVKRMEAKLDNSGF